MTADKIFTTHFVPHHNAALSFARGLTKDDNLAQDVLQEAFISVLKRLRKSTEGIDLSSESNAKNYLFTAVKSRYLTHIQRENKRKNVSLDEDYTAPLELEAQEDNIFNHPQKELIFRAICKIKPNLRLMLALKDLHGYKESEIACLLNMPEGTVKSKLFSARKKVRTHLIKRNQVVIF